MAENENKGRTAGQAIGDTIAKGVTQGAIGLATGGVLGAVAGSVLQPAAESLGNSAITLSNDIAETVRPQVSGAIISVGQNVQADGAALANGISNITAGIADKVANVDVGATANAVSKAVGLNIDSVANTFRNIGDLTAEVVKNGAGLTGQVIQDNASRVAETAVLNEGLPSVIHDALAPAARATIDAATTVKTVGDALTQTNLTVEGVKVGAMVGGATMGTMGAVKGLTNSEGNQAQKTEDAVAKGLMKGLGGMIEAAQQQQAIIGPNTASVINRRAAQTIDGIPSITT